MEKKKDFDKDISLKDFEILGTLGEGAFGEVFLVKYYFEKNKKFALKCINKKFIIKNKKKHYIEMEKLLLNYLDSSYVVKWYGEFENEENIFFLLEYIENGELLDYIKKEELSNEEIQFITLQILDILDFLHYNGIYHKDLKPENLMITQDKKLKIIDFGTCQINENEKNKVLVNSINVINKNLIRKRTSMAGTSSYMCPEIINNEEINESCDYWSLGIILFFMLTKELPFKGGNDHEIFNKINNETVDFKNYNVSKEAKDFVLKLLNKNSEERIKFYKEARNHEFLKSNTFLEENYSPLKENKFFKKTISKPNEFDLKILNLENKSNTSNNKKVLISGLVKKMKMKILYNTRQLILYSNGELNYYNPKTNEKRGTIVLDKKTCFVEKKNDKKFFINIPNRIFLFDSLDYNSSDWIQNLKTFIPEK